MNDIASTKNHRKNALSYFETSFDEDGKRWIPHKKSSRNIRMSGESVVPVYEFKAYQRTKYQKVQPLAIETATDRTVDVGYPVWLIRWFAIGISSFLGGAILLLVTPFAGGNGLAMFGGGFAALGSVVVAITVLRGQDLDERTTG